MAAPERPLTPSWVGLRLPGSSRLRFRQSELADLRRDDWVAVPGAWGEDGGQVIYAADRFAQAPADTDGPSIQRRLDETEIEALSRASQRALSLMPELGRLAAEQVPGLQLTGLRFTIGETAAVIECLTPRETSVADLQQAAALLTGLPTHLEPAADRLGGGLGRLDRRWSNLDQLVRERFDLPLGPAVFAPEGLPRLGAQVRTEYGPGVLLGVALKRRLATVQLNDGSQISLPLDRLRPAGE